MARDGRAVIAELAVGTQDLLGESPVWSPTDGDLLWLDLDRALLHRWNGDRVTTVVITVPGPLGGMVRTSRPNVALLAHGARLDLLDLRTGVVTPLLQPLAGLPGIRANDVKTDPDGRVWMNTTVREGALPRGVLLRVSEEAALIVDAGFAIGNGPAFSADGTRLYATDSTTGSVWSYLLQSDGTAHDRRELVRLPTAQGQPDGMTVDSEGGLWIALWGGGAVVRYDARGRRTHRIEVPAPLVTSIVFGGADLDLLHITTARTGLSDEALQAAPHSGGVFVAAPGVMGLSERAAEVPIA